MSLDPLGPQVEVIRRFNGFYTNYIGLLDEGLSASDYSLTEGRVLRELAERGSATASELVADLGIDPGYFSRLARDFREKGLVKAQRSKEDGRKMMLSLTSDGEAVFAQLDLASREQIATLLDGLSEVHRSQFVNSAAAIQEALSTQSCATPPVVLRQPRPGDLGWVVASHGEHYSKEHGLNAAFEGLVAGIVAKFARTADPLRECCWIAEMEGRNVGSIFVMQQSEHVAQLRLLLVDPIARGTGLGGLLVDEVISFSRRVGYETLKLWTNDHLHAAGRLYQARGFVLVSEEPHELFGKNLIGQSWEMAL